MSVLILFLLLLRCDISSQFLFLWLFLSSKYNILFKGFFGIEENKGGSAEVKL